MAEFQSQEYLSQGIEEKESSTVRHCTNCGATLNDGDIYCAECGEKVGGEKRVCKWCGFLTTKEVCPECGKRVVPRICKKCNKEAYFDICENCGEVLSPALQKALDKEQKPIEQMSQKDADDILQDFQQCETKELQHFRDKVREHTILLEEKGYFTEREKRIEKVFGTNSSAIRYPDESETRFLQVATKALRASALKREQEAIDSALLKKFPGVKSSDEEHEKFIALIKEREALLKKSLEDESKTLDNDIAQAAQRRRLEEEERKRKLAELQKKIEAERKRQEAIERERKQLELEIFTKRICGTYISDDYYQEIKLLITAGSNNKITGKVLTTTYEKHSNENKKDRLDGSIYVSLFEINNFDGTNFDFTEHSGRYTKNPNNAKGDDLLHSFHGTLNDSGTVINGYWFNSHTANNYFDYRKF